MIKTPLNRAIADVKEHLELNGGYAVHGDYDDAGPTDDDAIERLMGDCGMSEDGCDLDGTEYCDWDCPFGGGE